MLWDHVLAKQSSVSKCNVFSFGITAVFYDFQVEITPCGFFVNCVNFCHILGHCFPYSRSLQLARETGENVSAAFFHFSSFLKQKKVRKRPGGQGRSKNKFSRCSFYFEMILKVCYVFPACWRDGFLFYFCNFIFIKSCGQIY